VTKKGLSLTGGALIGLALLTVGVTQAPRAATREPAAGLSDVTRTEAQPADAFGSAPIRLVTAHHGNTARYRVREQLARLDFPNDAVGETTSITGTLVLDDRGAVVRQESRFEVDLSTLKSDSDRRDNYIRRRTLQTDTYPKAVFVPTALRGAPNPLPTSGEFTFKLEGELTIRDVTRPVTWDVTARASQGGYTGTAVTEFTFGTFNLEIPRVASVLSIRDNIRLEYDFHLVPQK